MPQPAAPSQVATFSRAYPGTTDQARAVRTDLRTFLGDCPVGLDVILCASELAANAAVHSKSGRPGASFTVRAELHHGDYVWIEIEDRGGDWTNPDAGTGLTHGLDIISTLSADWGVDGSPDGHIVWARLDWPADA
jgi:anti-sigma regulatory factor (Ser/Thr protein kinase)